MSGLLTALDACTGVVASWRMHSSRSSQCDLRMRVRLGPSHTPKLPQSLGSSLNPSGKLRAA